MASAEELRALDALQERVSLLRRNADSGWEFDAALAILGELIELIAQPPSDAERVQPKGDA